MQQRLLLRTTALGTALSNTSVWCTRAPTPGLFRCPPPGQSAHTGKSLSWPVAGASSRIARYPCGTSRSTYPRATPMRRERIKLLSIQTRTTHHSSPGHIIMQDKSHQAFFDFIANRARSEGRAAYHTNEPRHAPARFGTYSGNWVEGWDAAALEAAQTDTRQKLAA